MLSIQYHLALIHVIAADALHANTHFQRAYQQKRSVEKSMEVRIDALPSPNHSRRTTRGVEGTRRKKQKEQRPPSTRVCSSEYSNVATWNPSREYRIRKRKRIARLGKFAAERGISHAHDRSFLCRTRPNAGKILERRLSALRRLLITQHNKALCLEGTYPPRWLFPFPHSK